MHYFGSIRRSDWLPRQEREDQQLARSIESQSSDDQDREEDENYESSGCDDDFDGELGRLCRGQDADADAVSESSGEQEDGAAIQLELFAGAKRPREQEQDALSALL